MTGTQALLSQAKIFGGIGSVLLLLIVAPVIGFLLGVVGLILILVAIGRIADAVRDPSISRNAVLAVVSAIVGVLIGGLVIFGAVFRFIGLGTFAGPDWIAFSTPTDVWGFLATMLIGLLAIWAFYVVSAVFLKRSADAIAARLNLPMFHTAALLYLIGAALAVIVVGFALIFVAQILFVVAFLSIPEDAPRTAGVPA